MAVRAQSSARPQAETPRIVSGRPKQARSQRTLLRLLDAAEGLIEEKGLADASIPEIVRRARSSVGGFYARFRDKEELLQALEERFFDRMRLRLDGMIAEAPWGDGGLATIVRYLVVQLVTEAVENRNLIATFLSRMPSSPGLHANARQFQRAVQERWTTLLLAHRSEIEHPDPRLAIDLAGQFAFQLVLYRVRTGELTAAGRTVSDADLCEEIARNFLAYLGVRSADASSPEPPRAPRPTPTRRKA